MLKRQHFATLDGLRGVAALIVLILHCVEQHDLTALPFAPLAVDFFYVLSGFVVAFAYEDKLASRSFTFGSFALVRLKRLYPLIFLGTIGGIALAIIAVVFKGTITIEQMAISSLCALLVLPTFIFPQWDTAYPLNMATWSLTFELFVNAVYCVIAPKLSHRNLFIVMMTSFLLLALDAASHNGIWGGNNQENFMIGFLRVMFPFFAGVTIYRFKPVCRSSTAAATGILASLSILLLMPLHSNALSSMLYVTVLFPCIVYGGSAFAPGTKIAGICRAIGNLSYPVYILQAPIFRIGGGKR